MFGVEIDYYIAESLVSLLESGESAISKERCVAELKRGLKIAWDDTIDDDKDWAGHDPEGDDFELEIEDCA